MRYLIILFLLLLLPIFTVGETLYCGDFGIPEILAPGANQKGIEDRICQFIFDSLVIQKNDSEFVFSLAEEVDASPDSLSYTFLLKSGIKWQDGTLLTAKDVEFTLEVLLNTKSDNYNPVLSMFIDDVTFVNPKILTITLTRPFYNPLSLFTFKILPKHVFQKNFLKQNDEFAKKPLGCGPFKYVSGLGTDTISLARNEYFDYRRKPYFKNIIFKVYKSLKSAHIDLENQKIHTLSGIVSQGPKSVNTLYTNCSGQNIHLLTFNHKTNNAYGKILKNSSFRHALSQAIDKKKWENSFSPYESIVFVSAPFPYKSWFYNKSIRTKTYSPAVAKQDIDKVLLENGLLQQKDGFWYLEQKPFLLKIAFRENSQEVQKVLEDLAKVIENIGIKVALIPISECGENYDLYFQEFIFSDTSSLLELFSLAEGNSEKYKSSYLSELLHELYTTLTPWRMQEITYKIHNLVNTESAIIFLWQLNRYVAYNSVVKNLQVHPKYTFNFPEQWKFSSK